MPQASDLPDNLKTLARRQALEVDNKRFDFDVDQLAKVLSPNTGTGPETGALLQAPKVPAAAAVEAQPKRESPVAPNDGGASRKRVAGLVLAAIGVIALVALAFMFIPRGQLSLQKADDKGRPPLGDRTIDAAAPDAHTTGAAGGNGHAEIAGAVDSASPAPNAAASNRAAANSGADPTLGVNWLAKDPIAKDPKGLSAQVKQTIANMFSDNDAVRRPARTQLGQLVSADDSLAPLLVRDMISDAYPPNPAIATRWASRWR